MMSYEVDDDAWPARSVVYIEATWGSTTFTGSGAIVGSNDVITAAHVIFNSNLGGVADTIKIYPSYDPDDFYNNGYDYALVQYFPNFDPDGDGRLITGDFKRSSFAGSEYDIALLSTKKPIGDVYGWFGIDWSFKGGSIGVIGHPGIYDTNMIYDSGSIIKSPVDGVFLIGSDLEANSGNSGGPVYYDYGNGPYVVGLVSTGVAAVAVGAHQYWLQNAMRDNDRFISDGTPKYVLDIARLYEASFDRKFDAAGLNFWIDRFEAGWTLNQLAGAFLDSIEFTQKFGDDDQMTSTQFSRRMYLNVLNREPDTGGLNFWTNMLNSGTSREFVLTEFSLSQENVSATAYLANIRETFNGFWDL